DLFVLDNTLSTVIASSTNVQDGSQDPLELIGSGPGNRVVVMRRSGAAPRFLSLSTNRGRLQYGTSGQTRGHSAAATGFSVAATPAQMAFGAPTPAGPFPGPFLASNQVEPFSSDGLRRSFFDAAGGAITPGNFLASSNGGVVRQKPDITAADGTSTTVPGFARFFGTSAAAPHAGAIAALIKQAAPSATPAQVRDILELTALDIMAPGPDRDAGVGIVQAFEAVQSTGVAPQASIALGVVQVISGNNLIDADDCNTLSITLRNDGALSATAISATLSTATPGITVTQPNATYADIGSSGDNETALFEVSSSASAISGSTITFTLTVTSSGGESPRLMTFTLPLGVDPLAYAFAGATPGAIIPGGGTLLAGSVADDAVVTTRVPFAFSIYDRAIAAGETVSISTNGNVQFVGSGATTTFQNSALPAGAFADAPALFPYWDDLLLTTPGGGIYTQVIGTPPNRRFLIEWRGQRYRDGASAQSVNFAVALEEGSSRFDFLHAQSGIGASANGASATVGVHAGNAASARATTVSVNQPAIAANTTREAAPLVPMSGVGQCSDVVFADGFE
ncbi:MAG: S8 family serine peptidase, partial [Dokdonella sp.]